MNNVAVEQLLNDTDTELNAIGILVQQVGVMSPLCKYLTQYSLMKACGVIEYAYKTIVADYHNGCSTQLQNYIDKTVRDSSKNPSLDNIRSLLKCFDTSWAMQFNNTLTAHPDKNRLTASLASLNDSRNSFAHGQNCTISFSDVRSYYSDSMEIIRMVDGVVV